MKTLTILRNAILAAAVALPSLALADQTPAGGGAKPAPAEHAKDTAKPAPDTAGKDSPKKTTNHKKTTVHKHKGNTPAKPASPAPAPQ